MRILLHEPNLLLSTVRDKRQYMQPFFLLELHSVVLQPTYWKLHIKSIIIDLI